MKTTEEIQEYLAKVRKTVDDANALVEAVHLRIAETDRMLAKQGLTREQVAAMRFTPEQIELVNAELKRRGLKPLEDVGTTGDGAMRGASALPDAAGPDPEFAGKRNFGNLMHSIRL